MDKEEYFETIRLVAGHSIIMSHLPSALNLGNVSSKLSTNPSQEIESFGLFDSSTPNYTTYYPDVTEEDLKPKDSDFIEPVFRMLSNTVVHQHYNPIEFPEEVLRASMHKLIGQTVNIDHEVALGNAIGTIKAVEWQESYKVNGLTVPAGINAVLKIDGKSNPRIARGIMMEPPSIHSNSVTVAFTWKPSHENMEKADFFDKLGSFDKDGKLIRKIANEIMFYSETSLVSMGADPFAQKVDSNKIVNPGLASSRKPIEKKHLSQDPNFIGLVCSDWKNGEKTFEVAKNTFVNKFNNNQNNDEMDLAEILRFLETSLGLEENSLTEENYQAEVAKFGVRIGELETQVETLSNPVIEGLEGTETIANSLKELNALKAALPENQDMETTVKLATVGNTAINELRNEVMRLYDLSLKGKPQDTNLVALINSADYTGLKAYHKQYDAFTDDELDFTCSSCGSHDVTRAKAEVGDQGGENGEVVIKSNQDIIKDVTSKNRGTFSMYNKK